MSQDAQICKESLSIRIYGTILAIFFEFSLVGCSPIFGIPHRFISIVLLLHLPLRCTVYHIWGFISLLFSFGVRGFCNLSRMQEGAWIRTILVLLPAYPIISSYFQVFIDLLCTRWVLTSIWLHADFFSTRFISIFYDGLPFFFVFHLPWFKFPPWLPR